MCTISGNPRLRGRKSVSVSVQIMNELETDNESQETATRDSISHMPMNS